MPKAIIKDAVMTGADYFQTVYSNDVEAEAEWLRIGARNKVDSIQQLLSCNRIEPQSVIELGCGTGAVIGECKSRGIAPELWAVDYSEDAVSYLRAREPEIHAIRADVTNPAFSPGRSFDVLVLSHMLEHLEDPAGFLESVKRIEFDQAVMEVPLDALPYGRFRAMFRDPRINISGHVQFFTPRTFRNLIQAAGFKLLDERLYVPTLSASELSYVTTKNGSSRVKYFQTLLTANVLPRLFRPLWSRLYYGHYAVLCRKA